MFKQGDSLWLSTQNPRKEQLEVGFSKTKMKTLNFQKAPVIFHLPVHHLLLLPLLAE